MKEQNFLTSLKLNARSQSWVTEQLGTCVEFCRKNRGPLSVGPRSHECENKQAKNNILFVNFACNSDLVTKELVAWSINDNFLLQNYVAESANYVSNAFFRKKGEIMLVVTNYTKNYASTIDKGLKWTESIKNSTTAETLI